MTLRLFIILVLASTRTFSQNWTQLPKTNILFSNFIQEEKDNFRDFEFEYFKKGDSLISVARFLADDFKKLFTSDKKAFDDIYKAAYQIIDKSELIFTRNDIKDNSLDTVISSLKFNTTVILNDRSFVSGVNEFIWVITNGSGNPRQLGGVCYINIVFKKNKRTKGNKYISTIKSHIVL